MKRALSGVQFLTPHLYAYDVGITVKGRTVEEVEARLETALNVMSSYYEENSLKPNPFKT